ncbi:hypothetical protein SLA2020_384200 [Shorea laevis]
MAALVSFLELMILRGGDQHVDYGRSPLWQLPPTPTPSLISLMTIVVLFITKGTLPYCIPQSEHRRTGEAHVRGFQDPVPRKIINSFA